MMRLRSVHLVLATMVSVLLIAQTGAASQGKGGKGGAAAVGIDTILLINPTSPVGDITAEIAGGGFLGGDSVVTLDGTPLDHSVVSAEMIVAEIPGNTADGDHEITVSIGDTNKESASETIRLGGEMVVSCISWFVSGPAKEHLHSEVHVEDQDGNAVIGATVTWEAGNDSTGIYQTNVAPTHDNDGHAHELTTCPLDGNGDPDVSGSGVTDWFCCIGAGKWDNEAPPGKRACNPGTYTARILDVAPPALTNMTWDDKNSELEVSVELDTKFP